MSFLPAETIRKKRDGGTLGSAELRALMDGYMTGQVPDYQMAAFLMSVYFQKMTERETFELTDFMMNSGDVMKGRSNRPRADKHSTGGVGDKTSLIIGPLVASAGVDVPMISGRGLGHTGGTLDKLESIPGFKTRWSVADAENQIEKLGLCFLGQSEKICPADRRLYALRDVTGTVESVPLICASIMSKKLAESLSALVLDIKFGSGAFMKDIAHAKALAQALIRVGQRAGVRTMALLTSMNQPLGQFAGNSLEVEECVSLLKDPKAQHSKFAHETLQLSLELSAWMVFMAGKCDSLSSARNLLTEKLNTGQAFQKWKAVCAAQGGDWAALPRAKFTKPLESKVSGFIQCMDVEQIGYAAIELRAGRRKIEDLIDPTAGIEFHKKVGDAVSVGEPLVTLYGNDASLFAAGAERLLSAIQVGPTSANPGPLIFEILQAAD